MTDHIHRAAWAARQTDSSMRDGLVETAGLPEEGEGDAEETAEILADPDTMAAIEEGEADIANGDVAPLEEGETELLTEEEVAEVLSGNVDSVTKFIDEWPELAEQIIAAERASAHPRKGIVGDE